MKLGFSWQVLALASAGCAALSAIFGKVGVQQIAPDVATLLRTGILLVVFATLVWATGQWDGVSGVPAKAWTFLGLSALAGGGSWFFYFRAIKIGDVSRVAPVDKLSIVFVAIFSVLFLGEKLSAYNWFGILLMTGGLLLVALK